MKIALVQQHASLDRRDNVRRGEAAFREAARSGAELIAFAELGFLRFLPQHPASPDSLALAETIPGPTTDVFSGLAREHGIVCVLNLLEKDGDNTFDFLPRDRCRRADPGSRQDGSHHGGSRFSRARVLFTRRQDLARL
jgi:predicted amidohydrolase